MTDNRLKFEAPPGFWDLKHCAEIETYTVFTDGTYLVSKKDGTQEYTLELKAGQKIPLNFKDFSIVFTEGASNENT